METASASGQVQRHEMLFLVSASLGKARAPRKQATGTIAVAYLYLLTAYVLK